jgi:hypothetical protein
MTDTTLCEAHALTTRIAALSAAPVVEGNPHARSGCLLHV